MFLTENIVFASGGQSNYRIPGIVIDREGTAFAFCNDRRNTLDDHAEESVLVCARKKPGMPWESVRELTAVPGWACSMGGAVYDAVTNEIMCSLRRIPVARKEFGRFTAEELAEMEARAEEKARKSGIRRGQILLFSRDGGETWAERPLDVQTASFTHWDGTTAHIGGDCHGSGSGVQLRHGAHKGRLLCPSRAQVGQYSDWDGLRKCSYNNAIYSDDHGMTWHASTPVQLATGEGTLIEQADGSILYNSRAYVNDQLRRLAISRDGGETFGEFTTDDFLREDIKIGCNASFLRVDRTELRDASLLPAEADGATLFVNPRSRTRDNMSVCLSFDSGATWSHVKTLYAGACAYSSLAFSAQEQKFILLYEKGEKHPYEFGIAAAEFDLEWLLA